MWVTNQICSKCSRIVSLHDLSLRSLLRPTLPLILSGQRCGATITRRCPRFLELVPPPSRVMCMGLRYHLKTTLSRLGYHTTHKWFILDNGPRFRDKNAFRFCTSGSTASMHWGIYVYLQFHKEASRRKVGALCITSLHSFSVGTTPSIPLTSVYRRVNLRLNPTQIDTKGF